MKKPKMFAVLPTLLTLGNAACGFGAITYAAKVGPTNMGGNELFYASCLIFLAMLFDMLDGSAARWTNQTSDFGAQLDSLCDGISFGIAPAFLMLQFTPSRILAETLPADAFPPPFYYHPRLLWVIAVLYVVCALLRLARFNVETEEDDSHAYFSGLPSPAAAGTVASFPIAIGGLLDLAGNEDAAGQHLAEWLVPLIKVILPLITLSVACLMVSRLKYSHVFNQLFSGQKNRQHVIQLVFTLAVVFLCKEMAVPLIFCYFSFSAPIYSFVTETLGRLLYKSKKAR
jgi:CDP-diacylglycerol---serine O-phosphatidyltransferase